MVGGGETECGAGEFECFAPKGGKKTWVAIADDGSRERVETHNIGVKKFDQGRSIR